MAIFGNNVRGSIKINGKEVTQSGPKCGCGNTSQWDYFTMSGDKFEAKCTPCGTVVKN